MVFNPKCDIWEYFTHLTEEGVAVCKLCNQHLQNPQGFILRKHIETMHNSTSELWRFFADNDIEDVAVCNICSESVRYDETLKLIEHLNQHDIEKQTENVVIRKPRKDDRENLYIQTNQATLVGALMGLMIDEGVNPVLFASKNMKALLNPMCDAISKEETVKFTVNELQSEKVVNSVAKYICAEFAKELQGRLLSLKIDMDPNHTSKTFYISVQFISKDQVETRILGEINLENGKQLPGEYIMTILNKFNIVSKQIVTASWDNTKAKSQYSVSNSEYLREIQQFEENAHIRVGKNKVERYIGTIAQLCVLDVLKNPGIFQLFLGCRNLTKFINNNPDIFYEEFKKNNLSTPELDSPWKWGSTYKMMNDLYVAFKVLEKTKFYARPEFIADGFNFNDNFKNFIDVFCSTFVFVQKSVLKFYTSEMNFGDFFAEWLKCTLLTRKLLGVSNEKTKMDIYGKVCSELLLSIANRSNELLNKNYYNACLYLDPRFQHTLNVHQKINALEYLNELWNRSKLYNPQLVDPVSESTEESHAQLHPFKDDEDSVLNNFLLQSFQRTASKGFSKILEDLKLPFHKADANVLTFWKRLKLSQPQIYILSTVCFAIPATQNYNKIICSHRRVSSNASNSSKNFIENLDLIRLNHHFLDKAIENMKLYREDCVYDSTNITASIPPIAVVQID